MASSGIDVLTYAVCKAYVDKVAGGGGSSINVVQTTGSSTEDVMSQDATTKMVFQGGSHPTAIRIGNENASAYDNTISIGIGANQKVQGQGAIAIGQNAQARSSNCPVAIGDGASASADNTVALGRNAGVETQEAIAIGRNSNVYEKGSVVLGAWTTSGVGEYNVVIGYGATADSRSGQVSFLKNSTYKNKSYNNTGYMLLTGVHDGQELHDVATVAQGNTLATSAPTTATVGVLGQFYTDTTAMHTYQCTAIDDTTDPDNPSYTWTQRW